MLRGPARIGGHLNFGRTRAHVWSHDGGNRRSWREHSYCLALFGAKPKSQASVVYSVSCCLFKWINAPFTYIFWYFISRSILSNIPDISEDSEGDIQHNCHQNGSSLHAMTGSSPVRDKSWKQTCHTTCHTCVCRYYIVRLGCILVTPQGFSRVSGT